MADRAPRNTYIRIADDLRGELASVDHIPSEAALRVRYGVSRSTVRRALFVLRSECLIAPVPGIGWAVVRGE